MTAQQITIIALCSKARQDGFQHSVTGIGLEYHTSCYASYTSAHKILNRVLSLKKRKSGKQLISTPTPYANRVLPIDESRI